MRRGEGMRRRALILVAAGLAPCGAATGGWRFDWGDEFDRTGSPELAGTWKFDGGGSMVREAKFDPANAYCEGGKLIIEARRAGTANAYTSAGLSTVGLKSWRYGRFEMRARIDIRPGSWPAWWTTAVTGIWPGGGEIDMMEYYKDQALFNVMDGKWTSIRLSTIALGGAAWAAQFHTWVMEWDSTRIDLSLDGRPVTHYPIPGPNNPFYGKAQCMRLNQAIGQNGGGPSKTQFPIRFEVDYVRHWERAPVPAYAVAIEGGTGSGDYVPGTEVSLTAKMPAAGETFDRWVVRSGKVAFADAGDAATAFLMPSGDVSVVATYKKDVVTALRPGSPRGAETAPGLPFPVYDLAGRKLAGRPDGAASGSWGNGAAARNPGARVHRSGDASETAYTPFPAR